MKLTHGSGPVYVVIIGRFITNVGLYLVIPFLAIYLVTDVGMSSLQAGALFAVLNFTRRGLGIPAGWASDRFGASRMLVLGLLIEVGAYLGFQAVSSFWGFLVTVALLGTGGSLNNMASRSLLATTKAKGVVVHFSLYYVMINAAALIGPLIGTVLLANRLMSLGFLVAAGLHLLFAVASAILLRGVSQPAQSGNAKAAGMVAALRDRHLVRYCLIAVGGWFLITQFNVALPLTIAHQGQPSALVGLLVAANAVVVIIAVWLFGKRIERRDTKGRIDVLSLSGVVMGLGWLLCSISGLPPLVVAVVIASIGEALFCGVVDAVMAALAPEGRTGLYLGYSSMAWAVGGVAGSLVGGCFDLAARHGALGVYWLILGGVGLATAVGARLSREFLAGAIERRQPVSVT
jgi:MFS transporter, DHA1 family, multidrug resistance protein